VFFLWKTTAFAITNCSSNFAKNDYQSFFIRKIPPRSSTLLPFLCLKEKRTALGAFSFLEQVTRVAPLAARPARQLSIAAFAVRFFRLCYHIRQSAHSRSRLHPRLSSNFGYFQNKGRTHKTSCLYFGAGDESRTFVYCLKFCPIIGYNCISCMFLLYKIRFLKSIIYTR